MILKISKSLTTALLLAVSFNNSYATNNIDISNVIAKFRAGNHSQDIHRAITNLLRPIFQLGVQKITKTFMANDSNTRVNLYKHDDDSSAIGISTKFDWTHNSNCYANNNNINDIVDELRYYYANLNNKQISSSSSFWKLFSDKESELLNIMDDLIKPMFQQLKLALMADDANVGFRIKKGPIIQMYIIVSFHSNIRQILINLENNNDIDTTVKQFFDNYIGDNYNLIFRKIFNINNAQDLNNIKSILQSNDVKQYLTIGAIYENLKRDIRENHKFFFGSANDSASGNPYNAVEFKETYIYIMGGIIKTRMDKINNIRANLNSINTGHN